MRCGTELGELRGTKGEFGRRGTQMRCQHVGVGSLEHRGLHGHVKNSLRVIHQVGVQGIVSGDQRGQRVLAGTPRAADLLSERGTSAGPPGDQNGVEPGDVDAQFQGGGTGHPEQPTVPQGLFQLTPFLGKEPRAIGGHPVRERGINLFELPTGDLGNGLRTPA